MLKAYEYRIYPTSHQEELFNKTLGLCRLYWNTVVFNKNQDHSMLIQGYKPTFEKFKPEALEWVKKVDTVPLSQMWQDIKAAYSNFFRSCKKQRKGKFIQPPKYKSKKNPKDSFRYSMTCSPRISSEGLWVTRRLRKIPPFKVEFQEANYTN